MASRAPKGSSISRMSASWAKARAMATRWRMPPDSSWGRLSPKPSRCTVRSSWSASSARSRRGTPRSRRASAMLARTVSHGNSAASWNMSATRPRRSMVPAEGVSRPAMRLSSVLLPQPDAPTRQRSSPACDLEGDAVEGVHRRRPLAVDLRQVAHLQRRQGRRRDGRGRRRAPSETLDLVVAAVGEHLVEERRGRRCRRGRPARAGRRPRRPRPTGRATRRSGRA